MIGGVAWLCSLTQGHWLFSSRGPTIFKVWLPNQQGEGDGGLCTAGLNGADLEGPTPLPPILHWPGRRQVATANTREGGKPSLAVPQDEEMARGCSGPLAA